MHIIIRVSWRREYLDSKVKSGQKLDNLKFFISSLAHPTT